MSNKSNLRANCSLTRMSLVNATLLFVLVAGVAGCSLYGMGSMPVLSDKGKDVKMSRDNAAAGCQEIGPVTGSGSGVMSKGHSEAIEAARINIRNEAAAKGANYVRVETAQGSIGLEMGTAYKCP